MLDNTRPSASNTDPASLRLWGPVLEAGPDYLTIDNRADLSCRGPVVLLLDAGSRLLSAGDGLPVPIASLSPDTPVCAYISPAMTLSLPPRVYAPMILCDLPADWRLPEYVTVRRFEKMPDGSYQLTSGVLTYHIPADCPIIPHLRRIRVTLEDITPGSTCLIWHRVSGRADRIVLF